MRRLGAGCGVLLIGTVLFGAGSARAQGTAFTYQGQLKQGGNAYNGTVDMSFSVYDAASGGNLIGGPLSMPGVSVTDGLFTVLLDFGGGVFQGDLRWLDITVGGTELSPRQELTPSPYSIWSAGPWTATSSTVYWAGIAGIGIAPAAGIQVYVANQGAGQQGLRAEAPNGNAVVGVGATSGYAAVAGVNTATFGGIGTYGTATTGVEGITTGGELDPGVLGVSNVNNGVGLKGSADNGPVAWGVWGDSAQGIGGYFSGGNYALWAAGKTHVGTLEISGGSDLAEPFVVNSRQPEDSASEAEHASHNAEPAVVPGMVVSIDPARPGELTVSHTAYDRKVAGILSGANGLAAGMVMRAEGQAYADGAHPVALSGRVWCYCDASAGAIEPGDLLTTAARPGHAMKATDLTKAAGATIGKAMTGLQAGETGLVLVLVNVH